tara:strand:+ start:125727 stop:126602 length:876 start_codon:yes stop_codon:yes gene_type:complete
MTAFSSLKGGEAGYSWSWELRSVNGKGLDLRLRLPDWVPGLEAALRARLARALVRGNVTLNLRLTREESGGTLRVDAGQLEAALGALEAVENAAMARGMTLAPSRAADLLAVRGVLETSGAPEDHDGLLAALIEDFTPLLADFVAMRDREGAAISAVLAQQVTQIEALVGRAAEVVEARQPRMAEAVQAALERVAGSAGLDPQRMAQELALIAIKADVTEELDRLRAHVGAARDLLGQEGSIGRKLDFLTQEFNREANTLCAKAQDSALTAIGLELKAVIDQLREQVQNIE